MLKTNDVIKPAVFLDRDGVLSKEKSYISNIDELEIFDYSRDAVESLHAMGFLCIVVTNQSAVARGMLSLSELEAMNRYLKDELNLDAIYFCPHYKGGIIPRYSVSCDCRKPKTGMIDCACRDYEIDLSQSYMVGDRATDIEMGQNTGITTVLVNSGYGVNRLEKEVKPDYIFDNLREFANFLSRKEKSI